MKMNRSDITVMLNDAERYDLTKKIDNDKKDRS